MYILSQESRSPINSVYKSQGQHSQGIAPYVTVFYYIDNRASTVRYL